MYISDRKNVFIKVLMFDERDRIELLKIGDKKDRIKLLSKPILHRENEINSGENIICVSSHDERKKEKKKKKHR